MICDFDIEQQLLSLIFSIIACKKSVTNWG